jgi:hypothetical protein
MDGPVPQLLALIDEKPLQYPTHFHLNPQNTKGTASVDFGFTVPTRHEASMNDIGVTIKANLADLALQIGDRTKITNGNAILSVDRSSLHAVGTAALNTVNVEIDWLETFKSIGLYTTHIAVKGMLDEAARAAFGLRTEGFLTGPVGAVAELDGREGVIQRAQVSLDLTPSTLSFDLANFKKQAGVPASAELAALLDASGDVRSEDISVTGGGLSAKGTMSFGTAGDLEHVEAPMVHAGPLNDFAFSMSKTPTTGLELNITGHSLDGTALGHRNLNASDTAPNGKSDDANGPFHVTVHVDKLLLREGVAVAPFAVDVSGEGDRPRAMTLSGALQKGAPLTGSIVESAGERHLTIEAGDAGQFVRGMFGLSAIRGGTLNVSATMPSISSAVRRDPTTVDYEGQLTIEKFTVVNQPFIARAFSSGSPNGISDLMQGQGISIDKLEAPFAMHGQVIDIHDAHAAGPSVGITADGYIDRQSNQIDLKGAFVPIYGLNSILGILPIVGQVLISKRGEGLIGVTYSATGSADEPQISTNLLSVLTPGILRRVMQGRMPTAPQPQANSSPPPAPGQ